MYFTDECVIDVDERFTSKYVSFTASRKYFIYVSRLEAYINAETNGEHKS